MPAADRATEASVRGEKFRVAERFCVALWVVGIFASVPFLLHPWYGFHQDTSTYIITARSLVAGEGYSYLGAPFALRPPGLSLLIAPLIAAFGTNFQILNLAILLCGALGAIALYAYARPRLGVVLALAVATALWLAPGYQALATRVLSDVPGLTLVLACLLLERRAARQRGHGWDLVVGVAIGLSAYMRVSAILLVPAIALARGCAYLASPAAERPALRGVLAGIAIVGLAAVVVQAPWAIRNRLHPAPAPADQTLVYDYATGMWHEDSGDPTSKRVPATEIVARSIKRAPEMIRTLGNRLRTVEGFGGFAFGAGLLASLVIALVRRRDAAEFFVLANLAVIAIYFSYDPRLMLPVFALALVTAAEALRDGLRMALGHRVATVSTAAAFAAVIVADVDPHAGWDEIERSNRLFAEQAAAVDAGLPRDAKLATFYGRHWQVFLDRPVYSFRWATNRALRRQTRPSVVQEAQEAIIDKYGIDTVILSTRSKREQLLIPDFTRRYGTPAQLGPVDVFRVRPRDAPG